MGRCWTWYASIGGRTRRIPLSRGEGFGASPLMRQQHNTTGYGCACSKCPWENMWIAIRGGAECERGAYCRRQNACPHGFALRCREQPCGARCRDPSLRSRVSLQEVARYFLKGIGRFFTREPVHFHKNPREAIQEPLQRFCLSRFPIGVEPYRSAHSFKVHLLRLAADFHWHVNEPCFGHSAEEDGSAPLC